VTTPKDEQASRGERFLGKLLDEDAGKLDVASDAEVERQMVAAGVKAGAVPTLDELMARADERARGEQHGDENHPTRRSVGSGPRRLTVPPKRRWSPVNVAATVAVVAVATAVVVANRGAIFGTATDTTIRADDGYPQGRPKPPPPSDQATPVRQKAFATCAAGSYAMCSALLDEGKRIDPAGESAPEVVAARKTIAAAKATPEVPSTGAK